MKNPASRSAPRAGFSVSKISGNSSLDTETRASAQHTLPIPVDGDGISIACFWKSPRNRREAVQVSLRQYEGHPYADFRVYAQNDAGQMVPTSRGISIGMKALPMFCKAAGDALRKATAMGLTGASS